jgi:WD40 repeat protein
MGPFPRSFTCATCLALGAFLTVGFAAAPPAPLPAEIKKLVEQLGDDDADVRKAAMKKLEAVDDVLLPALREAAGSHADVDVRLRLLVVARALQERHWGLVKAMGIGATLKASPWGGGYWLNRVRFSGDGKYAVGAGGALILYDLATGNEVRRVMEVGGARLGLDVSRDGKYALTAHGSQTFSHLVELPSLKTVQTFTGHRGNVLAVALSPDNARAASAGIGRTIRLWDVKTGKELGQFTDFIGYPRSIAFSPDGKRLLSGHTSAEKTNRLVRLFDVETKKPIRSFEGHTGAVMGMAFTPDGKSGISAGTDGTVRVWDLESGKEQLKMEHKAAVNDLAVSPDGRRALSAGDDSRVKLWDLRTGKLIHTFDGHVAGVLGVGFSPDGRRALSSDKVCCVRLWRLGK